MAQVFTIAIPDLLFLGAQAVAARTNRQVEEVIVEWIERNASAFPIDRLTEVQKVASRGSHDLGQENLQTE